MVTKLCCAQEIGSPAADEQATLVRTGSIWSETGTTVTNHLSDTRLGPNATGAVDWCSLGNDLDPAGYMDDQFDPLFGNELEAARRCVRLALLLTCVKHRCCLRCLIESL